MRKLKSGSWNYQLRMDGKRISITAPTKAEVEYQVAQYKTKRKVKHEITVKECIDKYIGLSEVLSPTTLSSYQKIRDFAFQDIMDIPIDNIDDLLLQTAINKECKRKNAKTGKQISPKTVKNEWGLISTAINTITGKSYRVKLPKVQRKIEILPEPEIIIDAIKGTSIELPCLLAMWCGMRLSEIRGLTYQAIKGDKITINQVMVDVDGVPTVKELAKTDLSIRIVPLPKYIKTLIYSQDNSESDFVVPYSRNYIYHRFTRLMRLQNVDISFHDLRHIYASVMLNKLQIADKIVQKTGGWKTDTVMKTVYSNTFNNSEKEAAKTRDLYFNALLK